MNDSPIPPHEQLTIYATAWCGDCHRTKSFLDRHAVPYQWIDIDTTPGAAELVVAINGGSHSVPTLVFTDGTTMTEPSNRALAEKLRIDLDATPPRR